MSTNGTLGKQPGAFEIYLAWSEQTLHVGPDQNARDVMIAAGLPIEPGCGNGGCGMCVTEYVEGDLIHRDACLNAHDREHYFCPCVTRAVTRVVVAM